VIGQVREERALVSYAKEESRRPRAAGSNRGRNRLFCKKSLAGKRGGRGIEGEGGRTKWVKIGHLVSQTAKKKASKILFVGKESGDRGGAMDRSFKNEGGGTKTCSPRQRYSGGEILMRGQRKLRRFIGKLNEASAKSRKAATAFPCVAAKAREVKKKKANCCWHGD